MRKLQVLTEAMEKAKEKYWKEGRALFLSIAIRKYSEGSEESEASLWLDKTIEGGKAEHIFTSKSFDELLIFLNGEPSGDAKFTTFGGAPERDSGMKEVHAKNYGESSFKDCDQFLKNSKDREKTPRQADYDLIDHHLSPIQEEDPNG